MLRLPAGHVGKQRLAGAAVRAREEHEQRGAGSEQVVERDLRARAVRDGELRCRRAELETELGLGAAGERLLQLLDPQEQAPVGTQERDERGQAGSEECECGKPDRKLGALERAGHRERGQRGQRPVAHERPWAGGRGVELPEAVAVRARARARGSGRSRRRTAAEAPAPRALPQARSRSAVGERPRPAQPAGGAPQATRPPALAPRTRRPPAACPRDQRASWPRRPRIPRRGGDGRREPERRASCPQHPPALVHWQVVIFGACPPNAGPQPPVTSVVLALVALRGRRADPRPARHHAAEVPGRAGQPTAACLHEGAAQPVHGAEPAQQHPQRHLDDRRLPRPRAARALARGVVELDVARRCADRSRSTRADSS